MDTIVALATPPGKSGVAVIRLSGPSAVAALRRLNPDVPKPRQASLRPLRASDGSLLDEALVLIFETGKSFTGEESVELHCHGSHAVIRAILGEIITFDGIRLAEPGEFTWRALENDKVTLAQVESLGDLIEAETESQRQQALRGLTGELSSLVERWRYDLIRAAALIEATIDFADEEVPVDVSPEVFALIAGTSASLKQEIAGVPIAERIRSGFEVAIVGAPNVGKSTLLNALAGREAAITSEIAGTTRDVIEVRMDLGGLPVTLLDTAGIRATADTVESIGVDLALKRAAAADLRVFLSMDGAMPEIEVKPDDLVLRAKADLLQEGGGEDGVSGKTGLGLTDLIERIATVLKARSEKAGLATHLRHEVAMRKAVASLEVAMELLKTGEDSSELAAEELRSAIRALDSLIGRIDVENVLDEIFANFCLGK